VFNFSWVIPGRLAGMAAPDPEDAALLRRAGITALVSLTRRPPFREPPAGMAVLHLPVVDMTPPTPEQIRRAVAFLDGAIRAGGRAAVHCVAGYGRTGTVLAAYLAARGLDPEEAIHRVRELRPGSIETAAQERAVHRFAEANRRTARRRTAERER
jgi:atypical dual specificity phosphatase